MSKLQELSFRTTLNNLDVLKNPANQGLMHLELEDLHSTDELNDRKILLQIWQSLSPGGEICGKIPQGNTTTSSSQIDTLRTAFLLIGFVQVNFQTVDSSLVLSAHRPQHDAGSRVALTSTEIAGEKSVWRLTGENEADDEQLIDAHALLTNEDLQRPSVPVAAMCAPSSGSQTSGARRACKNCTCGLAERETAAAAEPAATTASSSTSSRSACGSCYLGDAFRCSDCPYRGLPPFKPGDRVVLSAHDGAH